MAQAPPLTFGSLIRKLRKAKNFSLEYLAEDTPLGRICSVNHLKNIEKDVATPTVHILQKLLKALGVTHDAFYSMLHGLDADRFESDFLEIWDLAYAKDFATAQEKFNALKNKPYCQEGVPHIKQALLLFDATLLYSKEKRYKKCLETLLQALKLTSQTILTREDTINCKKLAETSLTQNEYRIVKAIALTIEGLEDKKQGTNIALAMIHSLKNENTPRHLQKKLLPTAYYNTSFMLIDQGQHKQALALATEGVTYCKTTKEYKELASLYHMQAKALHQMGDTTQVPSIMQQAWDALIAYGNTADLPRIQAYAAATYGVTLTIPDPTPPTPSHPKKKRVKG